MNRSWLVQRLTKPHGPLLGGAMKDNPFAFGGGYKNGGLSDDAMDLLRPVFSFDYMGAAEFEFGAVPEALQRLAKQRLTAFTICLPYKKVPKGWKQSGIDSGDASVYVLCNKDWIGEVEQRISEWATQEFNELKESTQLNRVLHTTDAEEYPSRVGGWLELDNGFMFFADKAMWEQTCALFGVAT